MADLIEPANPRFPGVYQLELTDRVRAGAGGISNRQAEHLVERTAFLKKRFDDLVSGALTAKSAERLAAPRNLVMTGDGAWSVNFDGSGNASGALTLANTGVTAGSYGMVTVDAKGRVTAGRQLAADDVPELGWNKITTGRPTTLSGYGIADGAKKTDLQELAAMRDKDAGMIADLTKRLSDKADRASTLAGYGITDAVSLSDLSKLARTPPGSMLSTFATTPPAGTLVCNGGAYSRATYAALFAAIGTRYGTGDGVATFNVPNVPEGYALLSGPPERVGQAVAGEVISHGHGAWTDNQGSHNHGVNDPAHSHNQPGTQSSTNGGVGAIGTWGGHGSNVNNTVNPSRTGIWLDGSGGHTHNVGINATGGPNNLAAGVKLLVCISY